MARMGRGLVAGFVVAVASATGAPATEAALGTPAARGWTVTVGAEARMLPRFQGSDDYIFVPVPLFDLRPGGTPPRFRSPRDGIGVALLEAGQFKAGPVAQIEFPRREKHDPVALRGLGDVKTAVEVGGFFDYWPASWLRTHVEVRRGFGGHEGVVSDQALDLVVPVTTAWTLSGGPRLTIANGAANRPYFSIDPIQSANSGLPLFDAKGGVRSIGLGTQARYQWDAHWASHAYIEYDRLQGDAANSPIVTQRGSANQTMIGAGATYSFDIGK